MKFTAFGENEEILMSKNYYSVGGGFYLCEDDIGKDKKVEEEGEFDFSTSKEMVKLCEKHNFSLV